MAEEALTKHAPEIRFSKAIWLVTHLPLSERNTISLALPTAPFKELKANHHKEKTKVRPAWLKGCAIMCDLPSLRMIKARRKAAFLASAW